VSETIYTKKKKDMIHFTKKDFFLDIMSPLWFCLFIMLYFLWLCSLCNTKATSKQALLLHAEGKKHWAKARAFHASQQPPVQTDKPAPEAKDAVETASNSTAKDDKNAEQPKFQESSEQNNLNQGVNVMCSPALL
jgi:hypothetical protein